MQDVEDEDSREVERQTYSRLRGHGKKTKMTWRRISRKTWKIDVAGGW